MRTIITLLLVGIFLGGCGGGGGGSDTAAPTPAPMTGGGGTTPPPPEPPPPDPPTPAPPAPLLSVWEANTFLMRASFGPTNASVANLQAVGYEDWITTQMSAPRSNHLAYMSALPEPANSNQAQANRLDAFFNFAINGEDQLRQRVTYALSQIMVVSDSGALFNQAAGLADYYDLLSQHAFGNFRDLMQAVTLHPAMGVYLSMLGNEKPDAARNIRPDENYAREQMQLFTIGLVQLNPDGSVIMNNGQPIPTYDQGIIEGFAHVFTGWTFAGSLSFNQPRFNFTEPMQAFPDFHDAGEKTLLNGTVLSANQTPEADLNAALDNIFNHPNVAPFISKQLIQRLVVANPSAAYISRVSAVFNDNGSGTKGDLAAVIRAILLDPEAMGPNSGKLVEPLNRLIALWRAYGAKAQNGRYLFPNPEGFFAQAPLRSPSVFNFYSPTYTPPGEISDAGLVSPEMQITNETTVASTNDYLAFSIYEQNTSNPNRQLNAISIDFTEHLAVASDAEALVNSVAVKLLGKPAPTALMNQATTMINQIPIENSVLRVSEAVYTIATSLEFATLDD